MLCPPPASEQLNALISEAFVQFFVRLVGHYSSHIKWSKNGLGTFQERAFCKAIASKTNRRFVKKFVKTNMFSLFIEDAEKSRIPQEGKGGCRVLGGGGEGEKMPHTRTGLQLCAGDAQGSKWDQSTHLPSVHFSAPISSQKPAGLILTLRQTANRSTNIWFGHGSAQPAVPCPGYTGTNLQQTEGRI